MGLEEIRDGLTQTVSLNAVDIALFGRMTTSDAFVFVALPTRSGPCFFFSQL